MYTPKIDGWQLHKRRAVKLFEVFAVAVFIVYVLFNTGHRLPWKALSGPKHSESSLYWKNWSNVKYLFCFGDSYTDQRFDPFGEQPSFRNPFGNPDEVLDLSIETVWPYFATLYYNQSYIETYNLAVGGSTVEPSIIMPLFNSSPSSFEAQLADKFNPLYAINATSTAWKAENSLFVLWFGINDITLSAVNKQKTPIKAIMASYRSKIQQLYNSGARNFLLLNVPPTFKAHGSKAYAKQETTDIPKWNKHLLALRKNLITSYHDLTMFVFDVYSVWQDVLADPTQFEQTAGLTDLGAPCEGYKYGTLSPAQELPGCKAPANQYFFLNELHTTYPVHNLTAALIVEDCLAPEVRKRYCS